MNNGRFYLTSNPQHMHHILPIEGLWNDRPAGFYEVEDHLKHLQIAKLFT